MDPFVLPDALSVGAIIVIAGIIVAGSLVQVGLGLGFGLTVAPLLALIDPVLVPAPTLYLGMLTAAWGAFAERRAIIWREAGMAAFGRAVGVVAGIAVLASVSSEAGFELVFGGLVLLAVLLTASGWQLAFNSRSLLSMSWISGLMGTITSVGAPPLALIYRNRDPATARPTLAAFFSLGCLASLIGLYAAGEAGWRDAFLAALMLPPLVVGIAVSRLLRSGFDRWYRSLLLAVSGGAGLLLMLRGLFS